MKRAMIAMSGGVDSSVAAYLTQKAGYDCIGATMRLATNAETGIPEGHSCCSLSDVEDARSVAYRLGIPYYVFNFTEDFREKVIDRFVDAYCNGETPNPCIDCNRYLKFEKLVLRAKALECDRIVTGHYARIEQQPSGRYVLKKALDETKDQSYALYHLTQAQLAHTLFPLGSLPKTEVRRIAQEQGFSNAKKHDSQDLCFVPDGDYAGAIERYTGKRFPHGPFLDENGAVIGEHRGIIHYTVGQRKGLGFSFPEPVYVCRICPETNAVVLGKNASLYEKTLHAEEVHWISGEAPEHPVRLKAKIRYRQPEQPAIVTPEGEHAISVTFDLPQRAITRGQSVVLYDGDIVVGGGTIR